MASAGINFSSFTQPNGAIQSIREVLFKNILDGGDIEKYHKVVKGVQNGDKVVGIGKFGLIGTASTKCSPVFGNDTVNAEEQTWDIQEWEVAESLCYADIEETLLRYILNEGLDIADMTTGEISDAYIDGVLLPLMEKALREMYWRLVWFGAKDANNVTGGGVITDGVDKKYFTLIDGFWKKLFTIASSKTDRRIEIAANTEATFALQDSKIIESGVATGIFNNLIYKAPVTLRSAEGNVIYCTQSLADALAIDVKANNKGSELQWESLFGGLVSATKWNGVNVVALPIWDEIIRTCEKGSAAFNKPHRAIYTTPDNLMIGTPSQNMVKSFDYWFEKKEQKNYMLAKDKIGAIIFDSDFLQVAF